MELYICKRYEDLKEGEPVLAFGLHVLRWDKREYGTPTYAFVPVDVDIDALHADLAAARARIAELVNQGFALMYSINQAITYDNEDEARKGLYGLPVHVVNEMNEYTQLLHDNYDGLPKSEG